MLVPIIADLTCPIVSWLADFLSRLVSTLRAATRCHFCVFQLSAHLAHSKYSLKHTALLCIQERPSRVFIPVSKDSCLVLFTFWVGKDGLSWGRVGAYVFDSFLLPSSSKDFPTKIIHTS